ncbi:effector-associated constant component EACC1, partial [Kribbella turkmenica]|uniref:effector-associated constant component EACC1 n=1 Tax=Kribbella turkmenica TaxID=2530375 RepID=UPI001F2B2B9B
HPRLRHELLLSQLPPEVRRELAEQEFMTQAGVGDRPEMAVALSGAEGVVPALVDVLKGWICRRRGPGTVRLTLGDESIEVDKPSFDAQALEAFLTKHG